MSHELKNEHELEIEIDPPPTRKNSVTSRLFLICAAAVPRNVRVCGKAPPVSPLVRCTIGWLIERHLPAHQANAPYLATADASYLGENLPKSLKLVNHNLYGLSYSFPAAPGELRDDRCLLSFAGGHCSRCR
jgi:hypothetical protein